MLVIASRSDIYDGFITKYWKGLMSYIRDKYQEVKCLLLFGDTNLSGLELDESDYLRFPIAETMIPGILEKTMAGFRYVNDKYDYDYIFRTNLSSMILMDNFMRVVDGLSPRLVYAGVQGRCTDYGEEIVFTSGCGFFLSVDNVHYLIEHDSSLPYHMIDDVAIGAMLKVCQFMDRYDMYWENHNHGTLIDELCEIGKRHYHIRLKNWDRQFDVHIAEMINPIFHNISVNDKVAIERPCADTKESNYSTHVVSMFVDIGVRGSQFYFDRTQLLKLDIPMTLLIDRANVDKIPTRPNLTILPVDLEDFVSYQSLSRITENRKRRQCHDHRNTPLALCLYVAKFEAVMRALPHIKEKKIVWLDFGLVEPITETVLANIDSYDVKGFRACMIHYRPSSFVLDRSQFYQAGYCGIAAGVMVGRKGDWMKMIGLVQMEFEDLVASGYGHAEEQIITTIYAKHPEIFDLYYGDYELLLRNYLHIMIKYDQIIELILKPLLMDGRQEEANKLMQLMEESRRLGYIS